MNQREQAQQLFEQGHTPAEIEELTGGELPANKVRAWKSRYKWSSCNDSKDVAAPVAQHSSQQTTATEPGATLVPFQAPSSPPEGTTKAKPGRRPSGRYIIPEMVESINIYIEEHRNDLPILKECCLLNDWNYDHVMRLQRENEELRQAIKKLLDWKEIRLERGGMSGEYNKTMVIFTLKQPAHGWSDKPVSTEGIELEDLTPLAELMTDEDDTDNTMAAVRPEA